MNYLNGAPVMVGDEVDLGGGMTGVVVCDFDGVQYARDFPADGWGGLSEGVLVKSEQAGLVHFPVPDVDLVLVRRRYP